jgi:hypothetical protein
MKSLIFTVIAIISIGSMLYVSLSNTDVNVQNINSFNKLKEINKVYDKKIYYSLYSLKELKSYSIISIDKIAKIYDNKWMSPATVTDLLSNTEKEQLILCTAKYLDNINDEKTRFDFLLKIKRWCIAESQMEFICDKMMFSRESLLKIFEILPGTDAVISSFKTNQSQGAGELHIADYDQAYFSSINYLAELPLNKQLEYYSSLYKELSALERN